MSVSEESKREWEGECAKRKRDHQGESEESEWQCRGGSKSVKVRSRRVRVGARRGPKNYIYKKNNVNF